MLAGLLSGDVIATWCGPAVKPDGWSPTVEARRDGAGFVLDGEARVVESAAQAAHLLVTCADGEGDGVTQLLVPADAAGIVVTPMATIDLSRRFGLVTFDCAHVGAAAVVGTAARGRRRRGSPAGHPVVLLNAEASAPCRPVLT